VKARYEVIESGMREFPRAEVFRALKVDDSSFYRWAKQRQELEEKDMVKEQIERIFWRHGRKYGSRRIWFDLRDEGISAGRHRIRRVMREKGLKAIQPRSFVPRTTSSRHSLGYSPNLLLEMRLPPDKPLSVIVGDITYLPLQSAKWAYLATWADLFSRRILGWAIREDMTENLIIEAFLMLLSRVRLPKNCIVHSDRGGQYASKNFRSLLKLHSCRQSMSRSRETYDNAFAESLFSRYQAELLEGGSFADIEEAKLETFQYIDGYYNSVRRHSGIAYLSPLAFESDYRQTTENRTVFNSFKPKTFDKNSTKGVKLSNTRVSLFRTTSHKLNI
jgi:transposase InsO family protein